MNLEDYIKGNRANLDIEKPDEDYLWKGISHSMQGKGTKNSLFLWRSIAAASVILLVSLLAAYFLIDANKPKLIFVNIDPMLANQEVEFRNQIDNYSKLIKQASYNKEDLATSNNEIQYLDDLITHYSDDLKEKGPNPKLISSLMDLYRKKIMLLERMLNEIEKNQQYEKHQINI